MGCDFFDGMNLFYIPPWVDRGLIVAGNTRLRDIGRIWSLIKNVHEGNEREDEFSRDRHYMS